MAWTRVEMGQRPQSIELEYFIACSVLPFKNTKKTTKNELKNLKTKICIINAIGANAAQSPQGRSRVNLTQKLILTELGYLSVNGKEYVALTATTKLLESNAERVSLPDRFTGVTGSIVGGSEIDSSFQLNN